MAVLFLLMLTAVLVKIRYRNCGILLIISKNILNILVLSGKLLLTHTILFCFQRLWIVFHVSLNCRLRVFGSNRLHLLAERFAEILNSKIFFPITQLSCWTALHHWFAIPVIMVSRDRTILYGHSLDFMRDITHIYLVIFLFVLNLLLLFISTPSIQLSLEFPLIINCDTLPAHLVILIIVLLHLFIYKSLGRLLHSFFPLLYRDLRIQLINWGPNVHIWFFFFDFFLDQ